MFRKTLSAVATAVFLTLCSVSMGAAAYSSLGVVSVKDYGAVGDGVADDTAEIQAAIDAAKDQAKVCLFPPGTYKVSNTLRCYKPTWWNGKDWKGDQDGGFRYNTFNLVGSTDGPVVIKLVNNCSGFNADLGNSHDAVTVPAKFNKTKPVIHFSTFYDDDNDDTWDFIDKNGNGIWDDVSEGMSATKFNDFTEGPGEEEQKGNSFFHTIRGITFDLGSGNSSAVALQMRGAQHCAIEDVVVIADGGTPNNWTDDAWGGIYRLCGPGASNTNIEVRGGLVGVFAGGTDTGMGSGWKFDGQKEYAWLVASESKTLMSLVGFDVTKKCPPAFGTTAGADAFNCDYAFVDGRINFTEVNGSPAFDNPGGNGLTLHNVYINNCNPIIDSGSNPSKAGRVGGWRRVVEYANPDQNNAYPGFNLINGSVNYAEQYTYEDVSSAPTDLVARHVWDPADFPSPDDVYKMVHTEGRTDVVIGTEEGMQAMTGTGSDPNDAFCGNANTFDNRAVLQGLIDDPSIKLIYIPKGKFMVGKNPTGNYGIQLRGNTKIVGVVQNLSDLCTASGWRGWGGPAATDDVGPNVVTPLVTTVANGAPKMGFIKLHWAHYANNTYNNFAAMEWRAGKDSVTRNLHTRAGHLDAEGHASAAGRSDYIFTGGGRHLGGGILGVAPGGGNCHRVRIQNDPTPGDAVADGTPLAIYNLNCEDGEIDPQCQVIDSSNVAIYGMKVENLNGIEFENSRNCVLIGMGGRAEANFKNVANCLGAIVAHKASKFNTKTLTETGSSSGVNNAPCALFKRGSFNWDGVKISGGTGDTTPPSAPSGLTATADNPNHEIDLNWNDNAEGDLLGYYVYRSTVSGGPYERITATALSASAYSDNDLEVRDGIRRYYKVSAIDTSDNESGLSSEANQILNDTLAPAVPELITVRGEDQQVILDWSDVADADLTAYKVYRSTVSGVYGTEVSTISAPTSTWTNTGLTNGVKYYFTVTSSDEVPNESAKSNELDATPVSGGTGTVNFTPVADAGTLQNDPTANFGTFNKLRVRDEATSLEAISYMKFTVSGVSTITSAKLKIKSLSDAAVPFDLDAKAVADTSWVESTLTYNNKPTVGSQLATTTVSAQGTFYELDLSSYITANGTYSIALTSDSNSSYNHNLYSKEDTTEGNRPYLEIIHSGEPTPPAAPTWPGTGAATPGDEQIALDWNDNAEGDLSHYEIYRSQVSGSYGAPVATMAASSHTDLALTNGVTYYYSVKAVDTSGKVSAFSTEVSATPADLTAPGNPTNLSATSGDTSVSLNWDDVGGDCIGYFIYGSITSGSGWVLINELPYETSDFVVEDLTNQVPYYFLVTAVDEVLNESTGATVGPCTPADVTAPVAPYSLAAEAGDRQVSLTWSMDYPDDFEGFKVLRSTSSGGPYTTEVASGLTYSNYVDTDVSNGVTYFYVVQAYDEVPLYSSNSNQASATPIGPVPAAPTWPGSGAVTLGDQSITLNWNDNSESGLTSYVVYRSTTSPVSTYGTAIATVSGTPLQSAYTNTGLVNGTVYYYAVTAKNASGESSMSSEVSGTPADTLAPDAPAGLTTDPQDTQVVLDWADNTEADLGRYIVYRSTTTPVSTYGAAITTITGAPPASTFTDTGLTNGVKYYYAVKAGDEVTNLSAFSAEASATPHVGDVLYTFEGTTHDGWVLESGENSNVGGSINATANTTSALIIGDNTQKKQYKSIVSFNTADLPNDATVISATLKIKRGTSSGTTTGFGNIYADIRSFNFNGNVALENADFQATATATQVATMSYPASNGTWSTGALNGNGLANVCLTGNTQFRVYFATDDDNDTANDYLGFYSAENSTQTNRPVLEVTVAGSDTTAPAVPAGLAATSGDTQVTLNWNDNIESDFDHYNVKRATVSGGPYTTIASRSTSDYVDTGRTNGVTYYYVISAIDNSENESANCSQQSSTPADTTAPAVPSGLIATAGNGQVVLDWADNADADLADYRVYRSTVSGTYGAALATVTASNHTDATVTNGVTYYYEVSARDEVPNESAKSSEASATPIGTGAPVTFSPVADAPVYENATSTNYGSWSKLRVRGTGSGLEALSYLKFTVTGITGTPASVKLRLKSLSDSAVPFDCIAKGVSNTTWTEAGITYSNRPAVGAVLDSTTVSSTSTSYELDLTDYITGNGTYSLALVSNSNVYGQHIYSKEDGTSANRPYLEVTPGAGSALKVEKGSVSGIGSASWTQVTLSKTYVSPVVVCTTNYTEASIPMVVRVRNAAGNKFEVKVVSPSGTTVSGMTVQYMAVEEGVYSQGLDGVKMEAKKITSTLTDGYTNGWLGQTVSLGNSYLTPVVLGQVMTANDANWSQFWCCSEADRTQAPSNGTLAVGKHVGEDTVLTRSNETLGFIVIEAGAGTMNAMDYVAGRTDDFVRGMDNAPPFAAAISGISSASNAIVTCNAMEGDGGAWAVGYGTSWFSSSNLNLALDEDQIADTERAHATEPVSYVVFE